MAKSKVTPRAKRVPVSTGAVLYLQDKKLDCKIVNIASTGVLVRSPVLLPSRTSLRLELTLPRATKPLNVEGMIVRSGSRENHIFLGIQFVNPTGVFTSAFNKFLAWYEPQRAKRDEVKGQQPRNPGSPGLPTLAGAAALPATKPKALPGDEPTTPAAKPAVAAPPTAKPTAAAPTPAKPKPKKRKFTMNDAVFVAVKVKDDPGRKR